MMVKIKSIAIVEDDEKIRKYFAEQIRLLIDVKDLTEFENAEDALKALSVSAPEIALFDLQLPGMSGIECIKKLKLLHPRLQVMVLTVYDNADTIFEALKAGANSYILKHTTPEKLAEAIKELHEGGSPISSQIARKVIEAFQVKSTANEHFKNLTRREQEVLELLARGFRYKEIADKACLSLDTVRTHIRNIYEKLQVNTRVDALKKTGLI